METEGSWINSEIYYLLKICIKSTFQKTETGIWVPVSLERVKDVFHEKILISHTTKNKKKLNNQEKKNNTRLYIS